MKALIKAFIAPRVYVPLGGNSPSLLDHDIIDAKKTGTVDDRGEYKLSVKFVSYVGLSSSVENTWDIDVTPKPSRVNEYLIKKVERTAKGL
ncbi:hypothetical protein [Paenibacillus lautus]|uniref:hypothetical protein n=1 Tax=Paenibacillus lautus TaxID=1401 RepID=UPI003D2836CC